MSCSNNGILLKKYVSGTSNSTEEKAFEEHLSECVSCQEKLDAHLASLEHDAEKPHVTAIDELPQNQHKRIIQKAKWRNHFTSILMAFTLIIITCLLSFIITFFYYEIGDRSERARLTIQTLTQMTTPNVYVGLSSDQSNIFFNADIEGDINKSLGKQEQYIGEIEGNMVLNKLSVNRHWTTGIYKEKLYFLNMRSKEKDTLDNPGWETLEKLPEGTVAELAITFNKPILIDDLYRLMKPYDLRIAWYGIDTGAIVSSDVPYIYAVNGAIGFHEMALYNFILKEGLSNNGKQSKKYEHAIKYALQFLSENEKYVKAYGKWLTDDARDFKAQLKYVEENGIRLYGAVITGPTEELLKLKSNDQIIFATVGEVDFWNWQAQPDMIYSFWN